MSGGEGNRRKSQYGPRLGSVGFVGTSPECFDDIEQESHEAIVPSVPSVPAFPRLTVGVFASSVGENVGAIGPIGRFTDKAWMPREDSNLN